MSKTPPRSSERQHYDYFEALDEGLHVLSWCPAPQPTVPPTQVHVIVPLAGARIVVRFKGPNTLDRFIAALQLHREDVFGKPEGT